MQTTIIAPDLTLQPLETQHAPALYQLIEQDREYLRRFQNWPDRIQSVQNMQSLIRQSQYKRRNNDGFDMVILHNGQPAGKIGMVYINWNKRLAEIGYWLGANFQRRGLITRSCETMLDYAFKTMQLDVVHIRCATGNTRSRAVPERLNFHYDGILPNPVWVHGIRMEDVRYSMQRTQWLHNQKDFTA